MGLISFTILGLIVGAISKNLMPGRVHGGWGTSLVLGVIGSWVGGFLGSKLLGVDTGTFFELRTWLLSIAGGVIVAGGYGWWTSRNKEINRHHRSSIEE